MRYTQGGGLTVEGRRRREQVRLEAVKRFEQRAPAAAIAAELRLSERSVRRWRQAWLAGGPAGMASRGQAARCRLDEEQLAALDVVLDAGPLAAGCEDQRWTLPGSHLPSTALGSPPSAGRLAPQDFSGPVVLR
jgi:hypothetical protein